MLTIDQIVETTQAKPCGENGWRGHCPAHDDKNPSLSISNRHGKVLVRCHAGCSQDQVLAALSSGSSITSSAASKSPVRSADELVEEREYVYVSSSLAPTLKVQRLKFKSGRKKFIQFHYAENGWRLGKGDSDPLPYRYERWKDEPEVILVEGEKAVEALESLGLSATTTPGGAGAWTEKYKSAFAGKRVPIWRDNDEPGLRYAEAAARDIATVAAEVRLVPVSGFAPKYDAADFVAECRSREDVLKLLETSVPFKGAAPELSHEWPPPVMFDDGQLPRFPTEVYPEPVRNMIEALSEATETPVELPGMLALAVLAAACAGKAEVRIKSDYAEPLNLFVAAVLPSGNRKSGTFRAMTEPLTVWERERRVEIQPRIAEAKSRRLNEEARIKQLRRLLEKGDDRSLEVEIIDLESKLTEVPVVPTLFTTDATPEAVVRLLKDNHGRIALMSDEGGIFDTFLGRYSSGMPNLDVLLKGHDGGVIRVDRKSAEPIVIEDPKITAAVSPQPHVLRTLAATDGVVERGLLARFLFAVPKSPLGSRRHDGRILAASAQESYHRLVLDLLRLKALPCDIALEPDAAEAFFSFQREMEPMLGEGGELDGMSAWGSKLPGAVARIAGLFALAEQLGESEVVLSEMVMSSAVSLGRALIPHAQAAFQEMSLLPVTESARAVFRWIERKNKAEFTKSDLHRDLRRRFGQAAEMDTVLAELCRRNIIRPVGHRSGSPGRPAERFEVNPQLRAVAR